MNTIIEHGPSFAWLRAKLRPGEEIQAEAGAMVSMEPQVEISTPLNSGKKSGIFSVIWTFLVAVSRKFLGGETVFVNRFTSSTSGEVILAPKLSGQIMARSLRPNAGLLVQAGSYLASSGQVDTKLRFGGLRTLFGGEGLVLLHCEGEGDLFLNAYGGITEIPINGEFTIDTGHIVAFDDALDFQVKGIGGLKSLFFSGEGLVCNFKGQGNVYIQSRNLSALIGWLSPLLPR